MCAKRPATRPSAQRPWPSAVFSKIFAPPKKKVRPTGRDRSGAGPTAGPLRYADAVRSRATAKSVRDSVMRVITSGERRRIARLRSLMCVRFRCSGVTKTRLRSRFPLMPCRAMVSVLSGTTLALAPLCAACAQSMEPLSYTNAPIGLNFLIAGYTHQWGSVLVDPSIPVTNVTATVDTPFLAFSRIMDFLGSVRQSCAGSALRQALGQRQCTGASPKRRAHRNGRSSCAPVGQPLRSAGAVAAGVSPLPPGLDHRCDASGAGAHRALLPREAGQHRHQPMGRQARAGRLQGAGAMDARIRSERRLFHRQRRVLRRQRAPPEPAVCRAGARDLQLLCQAVGAVDGTYYAGRSTTLNGRSDYDL
ncbi:hypothetical protein SBBP1_20042 [Burkholderiales bacterium]|nr:hypothetical protein SBBP1_20042 [Burkholderiales bacterium]